MVKSDPDTILTLIGGWGKFQIRAYIPLCLVVMFSVFQMSYIFVARDIKYRCRIDSCRDKNEEYNPEWLKNAVPYNEGVPNRCLYYEAEENTTCTKFDRNKTLICNEFVFERKQTTIVQNFNITCDQNLWKLSIVGTVSAVGELFCLPFAGFVSDRFGRKLMIVISMSISTTIGLLRSFSPSYYIYILLEFVDTALASGMYSGAFILALEIVDTKRRSMGNTIICLSFTLGQVFLGFSAWISSSWRTMLQIIYTPGLFILISLYFMPESIRWLLMRKKIKEARKIIQTGVGLNRKSVDEQVLNELLQTNLSDNENENNKLPLMSVLRSKILIFPSIHCSFTWMCCTFTYYGLTIQSVSLSDDVYINFIGVALVEIPSYFLTKCTMDKFGRRLTLGSSLILGGVFCICVYIVENVKWASLLTFLCGKFFITVAYTVLYIFTAEMFPTSFRHTIFAICSMFGRFGSMMAPQVPLLGRISKSLPLITFSGIALTSGVLAFCFSETLDSDLPDEIDDAENIKQT